MNFVLILLLSACTLINLDFRAESKNSINKVRQSPKLEDEVFSMQDVLQNGDCYSRRREFDTDFIEAALEYFPEIAAGSEFDRFANKKLKRWPLGTNISISLNERTDKKDLQVFQDLIPVVEKLTGLEFFIVNNDELADMNFYKINYSEMPRVMDNYVPNNWGLFNYFSNDNYEIKGAKLAVASDKTNKFELRHLIIEEFIQSLGLVNDSYRYMDSIFQEEWTEVQRPAPIDWLLLEFLYRPEVSPGMEVKEVVEILRKIYID